MKEIVFYILLLILLTFSLITGWETRNIMNQFENNLPVMVDSIIREDYPYLIRDLQGYDVLQSNVQYHNSLWRQHFPEHKKKLDRYNKYFQYYKTMRNIRRKEKR